MFNLTKSKLRLALLAAGILCGGNWSKAVAQQTPAHDMHQHHHTSGVAADTKTESQASPMSIPDVPVLDQDGRSLNFYRDVVKGKVVAINFIFTTCTTICPPLAATFGNVQRLLGVRAASDVHLISVSVDPVTDTPQRLKAWAAKFNAQPGWTLVTGRKEDIDKLLKALNAYTADKLDHSPMVLIGNDAAGSWTRIYGLTPAAKLVSLLEEVIKTRPAAGLQEARR